MSKKTKQEFIGYLITDPKYYSNDLKIFETKLNLVLQNFNVDIICFRDKTSTNYEELAKKFIEIAKKFKIKKILLNTHYKLAKKLGANGVHLPSSSFNDITKAKELNLFTILSCHNDEEIKQALKLKVDCITYSPIFTSPKKGQAKGIEALKKVLSTYNQMDIIALGGIINQDQISEIMQTKAYGFASIRYFIQKNK